MKTRSTKLISIIALSILVLPAMGGNDFVNEICASSKYLKCVNSTNKQCLISYEKSEKTCLKTHTINENLEKKEQYEVARKYSKCANREFAKELGISQEKFGMCAVHLKSIINGLFERVKKEHNISSEKIKR